MSQSISYGTGMAYSFYEGYLAHVLPSDGGRYVGIGENISIYEAKNKVVFPVKKLFIVITKSLYCPPSLKEFNKDNCEVRGISYMLECKSLEDVKKDVAGVKDRIYRNTVYKIMRPNGPPVYIVAEFATPLHTLYRSIAKKAIFTDLQDANVDEVGEDFKRTVSNIITSVPECRGKCELVVYDDTNPDENLADILLAKIKQLVPEFEEIIHSSEV